MQQEPGSSAPKVIQSEDLLEFYSDDMTIDSGLYTATLSFGEIRQDKTRVERTRIRVSPHMLKAISLLTAKHVREFEERSGGFLSLPNALVHSWGLEEEVK